MIKYSITTFICRIFFSLKFQNSHILKHACFNITLLILLFCNTHFNIRKNYMYLRCGLGSQNTLIPGNKVYKQFPTEDPMSLRQILQDCLLSIAFINSDIIFG